mgnify:CR=1 FL=1
MPKIDFTKVKHIKSRDGFVVAIKGPGFEWVDPDPPQLTDFQVSFNNFPIAPQWTEPSGSTSRSINDAEDSSDTVMFLREVQVPADPTGLLVETGATGDGMGMSFDATHLVAAAGHGSTTATDNNTVFVSIDKTLLASQTLDILLCMRATAPGRVKVYIFDTSGSLIASSGGNTLDDSKLGTQDAEGDWTGVNNMGVGQVGSSVRSGINSTAFNGTIPNGVAAYFDYLPQDFDT